MRYVQPSRNKITAGTRLLCNVLLARTSSREFSSRHVVCGNQILITTLPLLLKMTKFGPMLWSFVVTHIKYLLIKNKKQNTHSFVWEIIKYTILKNDCNIWYALPVVHTYMWSCVQYCTCTFYNFTIFKNLLFLIIFFWKLFDRYVTRATHYC